MAKWSLWLSHRNSEPYVQGNICFVTDDEIEGRLSIVPP